MTRPSTYLGDSHNFGRRVSEHAGRIRKPRTLLWEWAMLSRQSPVRRALEKAAAKEGLDRQTFSFLPELAFVRPRAREGGEVERLELEPLAIRSRERRRALARIVGRSIALWSWLGVSDLHWENIALGVGARGQIVFTPLDIEMVLADLPLPTATKLLPDADPEYAEICRHACGVRRALPHLGKPVAPDDLIAMAGAYRSMLVLLDRHASAIAEAFEGLPNLREMPIRVCLRGTDEYVRARTEPIWPPLLDAEVEQLSRGDIPYFFRLYGRPGIHHYADRTLRRIATLPRKGDVPQSDPILRLSRGLRSPSRERLREEGLFALLGAFDDPSFRGCYRSDELDVTFGARTIAVRLPNGEELRSRRNLRAFVGSVYLPCRCGEVRSVLVPPVTVCDVRI